MEGRLGSDRKFLRQPAPRSRILRRKMKAPPEQRPPSVWDQLHFLLRSPDVPSREEAEQLLGLRPRPPISYRVTRPQAPVGAEWLDLQRYGGTWRCTCRIARSRAEGGSEAA